MKPRTCPNCGYKYSFWLHLKKHFFQSVYSEWNCHNCDAQLTVDANRRILLALIGVVPVSFTPYLAEFLIGYYLGEVVSWTIAIVIFAVWATYIFSFDKFILTPELRKKDMKSSGKSELPYN